MPRLNLPVLDKVPVHRTFTMVSFDLEGTGLLVTNPEIIQIAAVYKKDNGEEESFNCYILPPCKMSPEAENVTGFKVTADKLLRNGKELDTCSPKEGLEKFITWLKECPDKPVLVAHNCKLYDGPVLVKSVKKHGLDKELIQAVCGMADSLTMMREVYAGRRGFTLDGLAADLLPARYKGLELHDGASDASKLLGLLLLPKVSKTALCGHSWLLNPGYVSYVIQWTDNVQKCYPSIQLLCTLNIIRSSSITVAIAGAGYKFEDLKDMALTGGVKAFRRLLMVDLKCCQNDGLAKAIMRYFK